LSSTGSFSAPIAVSGVHPGFRATQLWMNDTLMSKMS